MKFNTTYKSNLSFKKTIKEIAYIKEYISKYLTEKYNLIYVIPPLGSEVDDEINIDFDVMTRDVSFENSEGKILKLFLSYSNWTREFLKRINPKINEGIYFEEKTLWRDLKENAVSTSTKQEITFAFRIDENNPSKILEEITIGVYELIYELAKEIRGKYKIKNIFPEHPHFVSSQQLENEMPQLSFKERENEFVLNEQALFLKEVGTILYSGKKHSFIPIQFYDLRKFNQILMFDRNNSSTLKVASIGVLATGNQLSDQLTLYGHGEINSIPLYKENIDNKKKYIEIKINIPRLAMALLAKGHIAEVQAGIISDESKNIKNRYGINIY